MSLKIFHIVFISLSILLSAALGAWGLERFLDGGSQDGLALGILFFVTGAVLLVYGVKFWKKMKEIRA